MQNLHIISGLMTNFLCFCSLPFNGRVKNRIAWVEGKRKEEKKRSGERDGNKAKHRGHQINDLQKMLVPAKMRHKLLNYLRSSALAHSRSLSISFFSLVERFRCSFFALRRGLFLRQIQKDLIILILSSAKWGSKGFARA